MGALVYLDTETTGLDPDVHQVWEIAYAVEDGPIFTASVRHSLRNADDKALEIGHYHERCYVDPFALTFEITVQEALRGATIVGANPAFDAAFLRERWCQSMWHHRLLDIEAYAMGALGYDVPQGLATLSADLRDRGFEIPQPDHTAAGDVATTRACHHALIDIYREMRTA